MVGAVAVWVGIGGLLASIGLLILLKYTGVLEGLSEVFAWIREMWASFLQVAPTPLKVLLFLFFVLTFAGFITSTVLTFTFVCDSQNNLKTYKNGFAGGVVGSLQSVFQGYDPENPDEEKCIGFKTKSCGDYDDDEASCTQFPNLCTWDAEDCYQKNLSYWAANCEWIQGLNGTQCILLGCDWISASLDYDNWVTNHTVNATTYGIDTPEGIFYPTCQGYNPVLTLRGVNLFDFRIWVFLIILFSLGGLALKLKGKI